MKNTLGGIVIALVIFAFLAIKAIIVFVESHPLMVLIGIAILVAVVLYRDKKARERAEQREEWANKTSQNHTPCGKSYAQYELTHAYNQACAEAEAHAANPRTAEAKATDHPDPYAAEAQRIADAVVRERDELKHITDDFYKAIDRAKSRAEAKANAIPTTITYIQKESDHAEATGFYLIEAETRAETKTRAEATPRAETNPRTRIKELRAIIRHHEEVYYVENRREISDEEFDKLFFELETLEAENPNLITANSPTQRAGGRAAVNPVKVNYQMKSIHKAKTEQELLNFCEAIDKYYGKGQFVVEQKIDGLSVQLEYQDGLLVRGYTRGRGDKGEDVTQNLRCIPGVLNGIPYQFRAKGLLVVRGEVYMTHQAAIDAGYSDARSAASATLRQQTDCKRARNLRFFAFELVEYAHMPKSRADCLRLMGEMGFPHVPFLEVTGWKNVNPAIERIRKNSETLDYDIDGAVVKPDDIAFCKELGEFKYYPQWAIAKKFYIEAKKLKKAAA
jgi:hypothetical protein